MELKTLYQLTQELNELIEESTSQENASKMDQLEEALRTKTDGCVGWVTKQNDLIQLAKQRIEELKAFIQKKENQLQRFDDYVALCFKSIGATEFKGSLSKISLRRPPKIVEIYDENQIPVEYLYTPKAESKISLSEIAKAIKGGASVPGARLVDSENISVSYKLGGAND